MGSKMIRSKEENLQDRAEVFIVGTYHFTNNGDMVDNSGAIDVRSDHEQIKDLVEALARYNPSALAVEVTKDRNRALNDDYHAYIKDEIALNDTEVYQVMFRLGEKLQHERIHAVDWMKSVGNRGMGEVAELAKEHQKDKFDKVIEIFNNDPINADNSILDNLALINDENFVSQVHSGYMKLGQIGVDEDYVGIDWLRWWYQRNLIIYKNVMDIVHSGNKKVMLLIGASHVHLLKQFIEESGEANVITFNDIYKY
ncbi:DUF5694 domain-containing protein [Salinicoccus hispanicus]|uniref:TraB/GumN family protein n=1 Tax=Salinicoccus hispanicus TaxID=157225 RepID=A0A6N8TW41_9STAP|nr:DUF5694 domain-containing protein [Salinicoccus hispanicus]MXQ50138.1 hypothetical protein [Salinicoccus hispanicus]